MASADDIKAIEDQVKKILEPVGRKVYTIVNYDNFSILPHLVDPYTDMVKGLVDRYYHAVTRYTTSAFLRMKIGDALQKRNLSPHIYESREEARAAIRHISRPRPPKKIPAGT